MINQDDNLDRASSALSHDFQRADAEVLPRAEEYANHIMRNITERNGYSRNLFPDSIKSAIVAGETSLVHAEFDFLREALGIVRKTQLQNLRESSKQHLAKMKGNLRGDTARFLADKVTELLKQIDRTSEDFFLHLDKKLESAEVLKSPRLRETRIRELERQLEEFTDSQRKLVNSVLSISSESL